MEYIYKITNLQNYDYERLKSSRSHIGRFAKKGLVKCTFRNKNIYVHLNNDTLYSVILNTLRQYKIQGKLIMSKSAEKLLNSLT